MQEEEKCKSKRKERRGRDEQREEGGEESEDSRMKKTDKRKRRKEMVPLAEGGKKRKGIWKHTHTYCTLPKMSVNHREYSVFSVFVLSPLTESTVCVCSNSRSGGHH